MRDEIGPLLLPAPVIPEVDHLLGNRLGRRARQVFYRRIVEGAYLVVDLPQTAYARVSELDRTFADLELGFVDAAIAVIAETLEVAQIATTDRRDFEPVARRLCLELVP